MTDNTIVDGLTFLSTSSIPLVTTLPFIETCFQSEMITHINHGKTTTLINVTEFLSIVTEASCTPSCQDGSPEARGSSRDWNCKPPKVGNSLCHGVCMANFRSLCAPIRHQSETRHTNVWRISSCEGSPWEHGKHFFVSCVSGQNLPALAQYSSIAKSYLDTCYSV